MAETDERRLGAALCVGCVVLICCCIFFLILVWLVGAAFGASAPTVGLDPAQLGGAGDEAAGGARSLQSFGGAAITKSCLMDYQCKPYFWDANNVQCRMVCAADGAQCLLEDGETGICGKPDPSLGGRLPLDQQCGVCTAKAAA